MLFTTIGRLAYHVSHYIVENHHRHNYFTYNTIHYNIDATGDNRCNNGDNDIAAVAT